MIFDKELDRSLWLMLVADKKNNDKIVDFITSIPEELRKQILEKLDLLKKYKNSDDNKIAFLCGEYEVDGELLYWFEVDSYFNELDMGYKRSNCGKYEDVFEMTLAISKDFEMVKNFQKEYIGKIEYDIYTKRIDDIFNIIDSCESEYNLLKTPLGYMVLYSNEDDDVVKHYVTRVNISDMPEELFVTDLKKKDDVNKLVRRKIK